jgi:hypothetical protein
MPSRDVGNTAKLGTDGLIYVPAPIGLPIVSMAVPAPDGTGSAGVSTTYAAGDHQHPSDPTRLSITGGTLSGSLILNEGPTTDLGAATKRYVDAAVPLPAVAPPLMDGTAAAGTGNVWARADHIHPSDTNRLSLVGGSLTGPLMLAADPVEELQAATKAYVDRVVLAGGQMQRVLHLKGTTAQDNEPAGYVGEFLFAATPTDVSLPAGQPVNVVALNLTPGDWDVTGQVFIKGVIRDVTSALTKISSVLPSLAHLLAGEGVVGFCAGQLGVCRVNSNEPVRMYLVAQGAVAGKVQGFIRARRVR